jgi:hypothetical protein
MKALSLSPSTAKKKKKEREREIRAGGVSSSVVDHLPKMAEATNTNGGGDHCAL